jgi:hypothetical protein
MMEIEDFKTVGFKQMHQMQIDAVVNYMATCINLAASLGDPEILAEVEEESDELIKLLGGNGLHVAVTGGDFVYREIDTRNDQARKR